MAFKKKVIDVSASVASDVFLKVLNIDFVKKAVTEKIASCLEELILHLIINNLISLCFFLFGAFVVWLFPGNPVALLTFSVFSLIFLIRTVVKTVVSVKAFIELVKKHGFALAVIKKIIKKDWYGVLQQFGGIVLLILPSVVLIIGYFITVNGLLKPILINEVIHLNSLQTYLYPILFSVDLIFPTNTLGWIG